MSGKWRSSKLLSGGTKEVGLVDIHDEGSIVEVEELVNDIMTMS